MSDLSAISGNLVQPGVHAQTRAVAAVRRELLPTGSAAGPNHYQTLEITPYANLGAIRGAYRRLARHSHPDLNPSPEATHHMQAVNEAYAVLRDPGRKAAYDHGRFARAVQEMFTGATAPPSSDAPAGRTRPGIRRLTALGIAALILAGAMWAQNPQRLPAASIEPLSPAIEIQAPD